MKSWEGLQPRSVRESVLESLQQLYSEDAAKQRPVNQRPVAKPTGGYRATSESRKTPDVIVGREIAEGKAEILVHGAVRDVLTYDPSKGLSVALDRWAARNA